jgi:hypothetical protein
MPLFPWFIGRPAVPPRLSGKTYRRDLRTDAQGAFTTYYGLPCTAAKEDLPNAPSQVIRALNLRMDLTSLHLWSNPRSQYAGLKGGEIKSFMEKESG